MLGNNQGRRPIKPFESAAHQPDVGSLAEHQLLIMSAITRLLHGF